MNQELLAYAYSFSSVLTFSTAAIGFTYFSQKVSPLWMNIFKCFVALVFSTLVMIVLGRPLWGNWEAIAPLLLSGFIGLNIGDFFLLSAYRRIGPGRTLIVFGFEPFIVGSVAYFFWGEDLKSMQFIAIIFFILCLFLFSYEQFKKSGEWEIKGLVYALLGVIGDSIGVLLTRYSFSLSSELQGLEALHFRALGAFVSFIFFIPFVRIGLIYHFKKLTLKQKSIAVVSSFFGTFMSLVLYMQAVKYGKLATVTSIVLTDPMMSTFFECLWLRLWPTRYLWMAFLCFLGAMFFLMYPQWVV